MKKNLFFAIVILFALSLFSACSNESATEKTDSTKVEAETKVTEKTETTSTTEIGGAQMIDYITTPQYGWKQVDKEYFLAFFPDGRLSIQTEGGEAGMSEGKWVVNNTEVTLTYQDGKTETFNLKGDGTFLFLNETKFAKYTIQ